MVDVPVSVMRVRLVTEDGSEVLCDAINPGTRDGLMTLVSRADVVLRAGVPFDLRLNTRDEK